ncbi:MAG: GAF domain-containing protein [Ignavibacteriales bacterium]|nr:GAF domain-containing protein [Ignavibacteriales bacterium]MCF8314925.1 GAF domain-containing protein [Ignavibacteriales bacterium]MCF8436126.1 GAF domain-containing protein [Ignavibacteriales bacterium]
MNQTLIDKELPEEQIYKSLLEYLPATFDSNEPVTTALANFSAAIFNAFNKISWAGFYILGEGETLYLGPFQGKPACTKIKIGKGVCGKAASIMETVIVPDVHKFPGHIACDSGSNSEIVLPVTKNNLLIGVFDLDSYLLNAFTFVDKYYLEELLKKFSEIINLSNYKIL